MRQSKDVRYIRLEMVRYAGGAWYKPAARASGTGLQRVRKRLRRWQGRCDKRSILTAFNRAEEEWL